jgi:hypothetical protein
MNLKSTGASNPEGTKGVQFNEGNSGKSAIRIAFALALYVNVNTFAARLTPMPRGMTERWKPLSTMP